MTSLSTILSIRTGTEETDVREWRIAPRLVSPDRLEVIFERAARLLHRRLEAEFSVPWREGKAALPEFVSSRDFSLHATPQGRRNGASSLTVCVTACMQ